MGTRSELEMGHVQRLGWESGSEVYRLNVSAVSRPARAAQLGVSLVWLLARVFLS